MSVGLYQTPWVSGTRAEQYLGAVHSSAFVPDGSRQSERLTAGLQRAVTSLERQAELLGGNSVISVEIRAYPWSTVGAHSGCRIEAVGTAAQLVPL